MLATERGIERLRAERVIMSEENQRNKQAIEQFDPMSCSAARNRNNSTRLARKHRRRTKYECWGCLEPVYEYSSDVMGKVHLLCENCKNIRENTP